MTKLRSAFFSLVLAMIAAVPVAAETREMARRDARALVERYIELHNQHRYEDVMALYAEEARFQLNGGRPEVRGKDKIRELELFDAYARSHLQPYGMRYQRKGEGWTVHIEGVIEYSEIFSALGMKIVHARSVRDGFELREGKIVRVIQPELNRACSSIAIEGFRRLATWLLSTKDHRADDLVSEGNLMLRPAKIPSIVAALKDWRASTGWAPQASAIRRCAEPSGHAQKPAGPQEDRVSPG